MKVPFLCRVFLDCSTNYKNHFRALPGIIYIFLAPPKMSEDYLQMYRGTTLGNTLQESLDEMLDHNLIQPPVALKVDLFSLPYSVCLL